MSSEISTPSFVESYMNDRQLEGLTANVFHCPGNNYNHVWKYLHDKSNLFKSSDLIVIDNWYKHPLTGSSRQAFMDWNSNQTRFLIEELNISDHYNTKVFIVIKQLHQEDYYEWSD